MTEVIVVRFNGKNGDIQIEDSHGTILGDRPWQNTEEEVSIDTVGAQVVWLRDVLEQLGFAVVVEDWEDIV